MLARQCDGEKGMNAIVKRSYPPVQTRKHALRQKKQTGTFETTQKQVDENT